MACSREADFVRDSIGESSMTDSQLDWGVRSDTGQIRENNEDSFQLAPELGLFVLSDGMGGQASGEVASRLATEIVIARCREAEPDPSLPQIGGPLAGLSSKSNRLASAIRRANIEIREAAQKKPEWRGMGATIVTAWIEDDRMSLAHVGDSRAYRFRSGQLDQLTRDHSFVAEQVRRGLLTQKEAEASNLQNVLLRALGAEAEIDVDLEEELFLEGDTILLCSDGLTRELSDSEIATVLNDTEDAQAAADQLVDLANLAGGEDNTTVIVLRRAAKPVGAFERIGRWFKGSE
jgi:PPM family protein phosphatase